VKHNYISIGGSREHFLNILPLQPVLKFEKLSYKIEHITSLRSLNKRSLFLSRNPLTL